MRQLLVLISGVFVALVLTNFLQNASQFFSGVGTSSDATPPSIDGWDLTDVQKVDSRFCNIERRSMWSLTREDFEAKYLEKTPVIVVIDVDKELERHEMFQELTSRNALLTRFGNYTVTLSSANRNSYAKRFVPLHRYLSRDEYMGPQPINRSGEHSWYLFGDQNQDEWRVLLQHYPTLKSYIFGKHVSLSFGIGPAGSGVPFHTHGHVFNEVLHGRKRWWLQRPDRRDPTNNSPDDGPVQDPQASTLQWLHEVRPTYSGEESAALWECTVGPGEVLYIPSQWHHATLNIGETVFMAAFV